MGKLIFIEANTTGTGMVAIQKAREVNLEPVLLTNNPELYLDVRKLNCDIIVCDTNNISDIKKTIEKLYNIEEIKGITTTSEFYIFTVSILAEIYNLNGNPSDVVKTVRNKAAIRDLLKHMNILYQPKYFVIKSVHNLTEIIDQIPLPCVVKPVDDSGSYGVRKCTDVEEVKSHVKEMLNIDRNVRHQRRIKTVLIEECVDGQEYSIETFSYKSEHQVVGITKKSIGSEPFFVEQGHIFPAPDIDQYSEMVNNGVKKILNYLRWENGPAHIEIKIKNNKIFLVEFNGRLAGGMIPILIKHSTGLDLVKEQIKVVVGMKPQLDNKSKQFAGIRFLVSKKSGKVFEITGIDSAQKPEIIELKCKVNVGDEVSIATNAYERIGHVIAVCSDDKKLKEILSQSIKQVKIELKEHSRL